MSLNIKNITINENISDEKIKNIATEGFFGGAMGGYVLPSLGAMAGGPVGIAVGGITGLVSGILTEKNAETVEGKGLGRGLSLGGLFGASIGTGLTLATGPWTYLLGALGSGLVYYTIYYLLTNNKDKAKNLIEQKVGKEKAVDVLTKVEDNIKKETTKDGDKTTIRV